MTEIARVDLSTGELVEEGGPIQQGRNAWARIKQHGKKLREDWLLVGEALDVGRQQCIAASGGLNKKAFGKWCQQEGFDDMDFRVRSDALWMLDNWDSIIPNGDITFDNPKHVRQQFKALEKQERKTELKEKAAEDLENAAAAATVSDDYEIRHCSMLELLESGIQPDLVLTDPPYPKEFIHLYGELAQACAAAGITKVAAMAGQSYLPQIYSEMAKHLPYRWTIAYLTPGGQATQLFTQNINTFWKPVLLFGEPDEWIGDVAKSDPNDNDKRFHGWGQSESGMLDLVLRLSKPGDLICDPFTGGGTTAVAALRAGRRFIGCDVDEQHVKTAIGRCELFYSEASNVSD